jgi:hypothetical protein
MEKRTLLFASIENLAKFSKIVSTGFIINTTNLTLTGKFSADDILTAVREFGAKEIATTEKVFSYNKL